MMITFGSADRLGSLRAGRIDRTLAIHLYEIGEIAACGSLWKNNAKLAQLGTGDVAGLHRKQRNTSARVSYGKSYVAIRGSSSGQRYLPELHINR